MSFLPSEKSVFYSRSRNVPSCVDSRASNEGYPKVPEDFTIMEEAPTRTFSWLKAPNSPFTFKTSGEGPVGAFSLIVKSSGTFG